MDKKIVVCGCTDSGYDVVNHLLINGIKITHIVINLYVKPNSLLSTHIPDTFNIISYLTF